MRRRRRGILVPPDESAFYGTPVDSYKYGRRGSLLTEVRKHLRQVHARAENRPHTTMFRYMLFAALLALACAAPASNPPAPAPLPEADAKSASNPAPAPAPVPSPKALSLISEIKTPASTAKLAHLVTPLATPFVAPISRIAYASPLLPQISPYAYTYSALAPLELAAAPSTYSIEQHGYHITY